APTPAPAPTATPTPPAPTATADPPAPAGPVGDAACRQASAQARSGSIEAAAGSLRTCTQTGGSADAQRSARAMIEAQAPAEVRRRAFRQNCDGARSAAQAAASVGAGDRAMAQLRATSCGRGSGTPGLKARRGGKRACAQPGAAAGHRPRVCFTEIMTHRSTADDLPQRKQPQHPDSYARDLNPAGAAGQNIGDPVPQLRAADVKELTRELRGFTLDELREIPVVRRGARLQQGATHFDLSQRRAFTASGG